MCTFARQCSSKAASNNSNSAINHMAYAKRYVIFSDLFICWYHYFYICLYYHLFTCFYCFLFICLHYFYICLYYHLFICLLISSFNCSFICSFIVYLFASIIIFFFYTRSNLLLVTGLYCIFIHSRFLYWLLGCDMWWLVYTHWLLSLQWITDDDSCRLAPALPPIQTPYCSISNLPLIISCTMY